MFTSKKLNFKTERVVGSFPLCMNRTRVFLPSPFPLPDPFCRHPVSLPFPPLRHSAGHGPEGAARVDPRVDAGGVARCVRGTCRGDRTIGSILVCMMSGAALVGAHCGSHCHIAWRLPIFASSRSLSHPDASPFLAARLDTAPDALCGSVFRLSSYYTEPPLHAP